ncbi:AMP-binding protein [Salipiger abyssi]|uniref:Long-chain acyl-CoA synthetase n=1 Tax=Salipiger abyssi TaxID=1250539 RepID=A0A1P8UMR4_9RHOB|nr:AMP-binding protein [Salipiger abyssi]APZ50696.1 long-chain acyl-CoA synthetase [Salipiger abyssi]
MTVRDSQQFDGTGVAFIPARPLETACEHACRAVVEGRELCVISPGRPLPQAQDARAGYLQCETSGSTGPAKRIRRSLRSWQACFETDRKLWQITPRDRIAVMGPLSNSLTLYGLFAAQHLGATPVVIDTDRPDERLRRLAEAAPMLLYTTPTQLRQLGTGGQGSVGSVRRVLAGGGFLDRAAREAAARLFPEARLTGFYGAAETSFITLDETGGAEGSVGRPYPGVTLRVRDDAGRDLPAGETGTIWVESPYLFDSYAAGTAPDTRWDNGFLSVGELGWLSESGALFLAGRRSRMFTVADRNVFPEAIESFLLSLPGLTAAAVLPEPDPARGNLPVAFVSGADLDTSALLSACRQRFGPGAAPRRIVTLDALPALPSGKSDLRALAALLGQGA